MIRRSSKSRGSTAAGQNSMPSPWASRVWLLWPDRLKFLNRSRMPLRAFAGGFDCHVLWGWPCRLWTKITSAMYWWFFGCPSIWVSPSSLTQGEPIRFFEIRSADDGVEVSAIVLFSSNLYPPTSGSKKRLAGGGLTSFFLVWVRDGMRMRGMLLWR